MTDIELANRLSEILLYNELSDKAKAVIDEAYTRLKGSCNNCQEGAQISQCQAQWSSRFNCYGCKYKHTQGE